MRDVDQELVPGAHGVGEIDGCGTVALDQRRAVVGVADMPSLPAVCITTCGRLWAP